MKQKFKESYAVPRQFVESVTPSCTPTWTVGQAYNSNHFHDGGILTVSNTAPVTTYTSSQLGI